jgi:hypothetical protein
MGCRFVWMVALLFAGALAAAEPSDLRQWRCPTDDRNALEHWQQSSRGELAALMKMRDQLARNRHDDRGCSSLPLRPEIRETAQHEGYVRHLVEMDSRDDRRIRVVLTIPCEARGGAAPAVVCIHGHGGNRDIVYDEDSAYRGFAASLARCGYVTASANVGQHVIQDANHRTLMGERLWDLIRVVDLLAERDEVDPQRIGCAGLSLGGEMAMWLGAMDTRIAATVSSGFLTTMDNLREGHCMCWDFPGLQQRFDFADIYCLICPRPLQCQNGLKEKLPGGFPVDLAQAAMEEIRAAYRLAGQTDAVELAVHEQGHVFDVAAARRFLDRKLAKAPQDEKCE